MSDKTPPTYSCLNSAAQRADCSLYLTGFVKPGYDALKYPRHGLEVNIIPRMASDKSSTKSGISPSQVRAFLLAVTRALFAFRLLEMFATCATPLVAALVIAEGASARCTVSSVMPPSPSGPRKGQHYPSVVRLHAPFVATLLGVCYRKSIAVEPFYKLTAFRVVCPT